MYLDLGYRKSQFFAPASSNSRCILFDSQSRYRNTRRLVIETNQMPSVIVSRASYVFFQLAHHLPDPHCDTFDIHHLTPRINTAECLNGYVSNEKMHDAVLLTGLVGASFTSTESFHCRKACVFLVTPIRPLTRTRRHNSVTYVRHQRSLPVDLSIPVCRLWASSCRVCLLKD